jgi:predicted glycogen debranching enzyme
VVAEFIKAMPSRRGSNFEREQLLTKEWLVTNGLGGYAAGTICGVSTRRYHGLLIAALPEPLGRMVMLNHLQEQVQLPNGMTITFGGEERAGGVLAIYGAEHFSEFLLESGLPVWRYELDGYVLEKRVYLGHQQNTVFINYRLIQGEGELRLKIEPSFNFRPHEAPVNQTLAAPYALKAIENAIELYCANELIPPVRLITHGERSRFSIAGRVVNEILYRVENSRGYEFIGDLWTPGQFKIQLSKDSPVTLVASTEPWEAIRALTPAEALNSEIERRAHMVESVGETDVANDQIAAELILAADQFIITPAGRIEHAARARASGDDIRSVIAGYHWFTDWGRDTMISLEGLTLATGRHHEAGYIMRTFAHYIQDGLIPNLFPEGEKEGLYHTADATLWFFHALDRYVQYTGDEHTLRALLPKLKDVVAYHNRGTRYGIGVDQSDLLLKQGAEGYQLTWMDAKVGDWVVTPRRGKAVEINALWYNALRLLHEWLLQYGDAESAEAVERQAEATKLAFNRRFWFDEGRYLYDIVDGEKGNDTALRPNQIFSLSLKYPALEQRYWEPVLRKVHDNLLTPVGLRSLAKDHPDYKPRYDGDLRARDAAYHQGTVWGWLIGPFVDAWLRVYPEDKGTARSFLSGLVDHMDDACVGTISEIFDAEQPFTARGCVAQAWSVAEVLRCWLKTA